MTPQANIAAADDGRYVPVTAAAYRALERERDKLRDEKLNQFPARLRLVREFGETANNDEYLAIREEETVVDARLARLEDVLRRARVVHAAGSAATVAVGSLVTVLDLHSNETVDYAIGSAHAPAAPGVASAASPVGKALLGRGRGEIVSVELPRKGRIRRLEILAIRPPPDA